MTQIIEAWNGPGRADGSLTTVSPSDNALHPNHGMLAFEHWYFDAHLDSGHVVVGFLIKRRPEDLPNCRPWVELIIYGPDGSRRQIAKRYPRAQADFATQQCDVRVGPNTARTEFRPDALPMHHLHIAEEDVILDLRFENEIPSWMPGRGETLFGEKDRFGWAVGAPRARVSGTVQIGGQTIDGAGRGYADHNWGVGDMRRVIARWHWGRLYTDDFSLLYATVLTQPAFGSHEIRPLMLARGNEIVLSTGEVEFTEGPTRYHPVAKRDYPIWIRLQVPGALDLRLIVDEVIHAHDLLDDAPPVIRSRALRPLLNRLVGHPGYFRFSSRFTLSVTLDGQTFEQSGSTLHELVGLR